MLADGAQRTTAWWPLLMGAVLILANSAEVLGASPVELGRRIYQEGILPSGAKLQGARFDNSKVEGEDAACAKCHRQSGMGSKEGRDLAPPVTGAFLFGQERESVVLTDPSSPKSLIQSKKPYTDESLVRAVTKGIDRQGNTMNVLMPRYSLDKPAMKALTAYLRQLSVSFSPGVSDTSLRFATVIAPGVDPRQRDVMLAMMRGAFQQRNSSHALRGGRKRVQVQEAPRRMWKWELAVWELKGEPETWGKQLAENYRREPVFAVISGLSNGTWAPVHEFCQNEKVPCLFPSVDLPVAKESFYSLYFSRGVALEADVLARHLLDSNHPQPQRLVQLRRDDEVARGAAGSLRQALSGAGIAIEERVLDEARPSAANNPLEGLGDQDTVVFWLRPADLAGLAKNTPKLPSPTAYFSGTLVGGDAGGIPAEWKYGARLAFPYEIGEQRHRNAQSFHNWLKSFRYPLVNEKFQSEVFFNLVFLSDITMHMRDNYYRDYLVERIEDMLATNPNLTVYPRLSLGPHQRFASKGAYIVRFAPDGKLVAESDWIVP
ncbi:MAG: hypothetical protein H6R26_3465 [Proteobacteria bacterium]|nr:hypothetical protein [Pseudomonadota bacterium]